MPASHSMVHDLNIHAGGLCAAQTSVELCRDQAVAGKGPAKKSPRATGHAPPAASPKPVGKAGKSPKDPQLTAADAQQGAS